MADQKITELPIKKSSAMAATDYLLGIDSNEGYQMLIQDLGDYILRNTTLSDLATTRKNAFGAINEAAQAASGNTAGRVGIVRDVNLDNMNTADTCGVYWLNYAVPTITGTKPTTGGNGLFIVKMQSNVTCKQVYISMVDSEPNVLYRMYDSGAWTAWTPNWITKKANAIDIVVGSNTIKTLTASDDLATLDDGHYRLNSAVPLNAPSGLASSSKYGYVTIQHRGASGYTYYEYVAGNGDGTTLERHFGWKATTARTTITWEA